MIIGKGADTCHTELTKWLSFFHHGRILLSKNFSASRLQWLKHSNKDGLLWSSVTLIAVPEEAESRDQANDFSTILVGHSEIIKWWWKAPYLYFNKLRISAQNYCPSAAGKPLIWLRCQAEVPITDYDALSLQKGSYSLRFGLSQNSALNTLWLPPYFHPQLRFSIARWFLPWNSA